MKAYKDLSKEELTKLHLELSKEYEEILAKNLKLDMKAKNQFIFVKIAVIVHIRANALKAIILKFL